MTSFTEPGRQGKPAVPALPLAGEGEQPRAVEQPDPGKARMKAVQAQPLVVVEGVAKSYDGAQALKGVSLTIEPGEIHGLLGANGAGKSTLIKVLAGAILPDGGSIVVDGRETRIPNPAAATRLGFEFLHQELSLVPRSTVLDNLELGLLRTKWNGGTNGRDLRQRAEEVGAVIGFDFPLTARVDDLSVAQQWLVAIGRSLMRRARLIAFDEPTGSLSARESAALFKVLNRLRADGIAILYVTHRLDEVELLCDRATVFRDGRVVTQLDKSQLTRAQMITAIVGEEAARTLTAERRAGKIGDVVLRGSNLSRAPRVRNISLDLHAGEVLGIAGLVGAGRTELARLLYGVDKMDTGQLEVHRRRVKLRSPADAKDAGIGLIPEERRKEGLVLSQDAAFNVNMAFPSDQRISRYFPFISQRRTDGRAKLMGERLQLAPLNVRRRAAFFSGGNQQKLVIARWLLGDMKVIILDEPTRGVDVGARGQITTLIHAMADDGIGVIFISADFDELLGCDRVLVMANGQIVDELTGEDITVANMLRGAYSAEAGDSSGAEGALQVNRMEEL